MLLVSDGHDLDGCHVHHFIEYTVFPKPQFPGGQGIGAQLFSVMTFDFCIVPQIALGCLNDDPLFIALEIVQVSFCTGRQGYPEGRGLPLQRVAPPKRLTSSTL